MTSHRKHQLLVAVWLLIGVGAFAAGLVSGDELAGFGMLAIMLTAIVLLEVSRARGWAAGTVLAGLGDEYARGIYRQANSRTSDMMGVAITAWVLVVVAKGDVISSTMLGVMVVYVGLWTANICFSMYAAGRRPNSVRRADHGL